MKSKTVSKARPNTYRPRVENLENRWQPGSLLFAGGGLSLLGSTLDAGSLPPTTTVGDNSALLALHRLASDSTLATGLTSAARASSGGTVSSAPTAPVSTGATNTTPTQPVGFSSSGLTGPAHVAPVGSLARPVPVTTGGAVQAAPPSASPLVHANTTPVAVPNQLMPVAPPVAQAGPALRTVTDLHATALPGDGGIQPQFTLNFSTFLGTPGADIFTKIKFANLPNLGNTLVVAGSVTDPTDSTAQDLAVFEMSTNGSTASGIRVNFGAGTKFFSRGMDVDTNQSSPGFGTIYVAGFTGQNPMNTTGLSNFFVLSISPDFTNPTVNWAITLQDPTINSAAYGLKLNPSGTDLFLAGDIDGTAQGRPAHNLLLGDFNDLQNPAGPGTNYFEFFSFIDMNGNPTLPSVGYGIVGDSRGFADLTGALTLDDGTVIQIFGSLDTTGNFRIDFFGTPGVVGLVGVTGTTTSKGLDVSVDGSNNYFITGGTTNPNAGVSTTGLSITETTASNTGIPYSIGYFDPSGVVNLFGTSIRAANNSVYIAETDIDTSAPPDSRVAEDAIKATASSGTITDSQGGALAGTNNDYGLGIDVGGIANTVFEVGTTSSMDFVTTPGVFQQTYQGGPFDGWVAGFSLT